MSGTLFIVLSLQNKVGVGRVYCSRYNTEEENLPPKQWIRGLGDKSKKQIYYKCKWMGGPISDDMPMKKKYDNSTIPCNFLPGYKTEDIFIS